MILAGSLDVPAVTDPPGELIYKLIGFSGLSASRKRSCATMFAETVSSTWPLRQMIRSCVWMYEPMDYCPATSPRNTITSIPSEVARICRLIVDVSYQHFVCCNLEFMGKAYKCASLLPR